jgi:hypothetical protein
VKVLITALIVIVSIAADEQPVMPENWQNPATWQKIMAGQTPEQSAKPLDNDPLEVTIDNRID